MNERKISLRELALCDGKKKREIWIGLDGAVYDVTQSGAFYGPGGGYSFLAGRDATLALARSSLDPKNAEGHGSARVGELSGKELSTLDQWVAKFSQKYRRVGTLVADSPSKL